MKMDHLSSRLTNQILIEGPDFNLLSYQSDFKFNYINLEGENCVLDPTRPKN